MYPPDVKAFFGFLILHISSLESRVKVNKKKHVGEGNLGFINYLGYKNTHYNYSLHRRTCRLPYNSATLKL
jgi:hypothetical protein